jgi:hypothetical protein
MQNIHSAPQAGRTYPTGRVDPPLPFRDMRSLWCSCVVSILVNAVAARIAASAQLNALL